MNNSLQKLSTNVFTPTPDLSGDGDIVDQNGVERKNKSQKEIDREKKEVIKQEEGKAKRDLLEKTKTDALNIVINFIDLHPNLFSLPANGEGCYYYFDELTGDWLTFTYSGLEKYFNSKLLTADADELNKWVRYYLNFELESNRVKAKITQSFDPNLPRNVLNLMSTVKFVDLVDEPVHEYFEELVLNLNGGNKEAAVRMCEIIGWKYLHPECYTLPMVILIGQSGGNGKTLFVNNIMRTMFGDKMNTITDMAAMNNFNGDFAGKTIVFFEEKLSAGKLEFLKGLVFNPKITIERKGKEKYESDQTALYFAAANTSAELRLKDDSTARRWSLHTSTTTLDERFDGKYGAGWFKNNARDVVQVFQNQREIGKFANYCVSLIKNSAHHPEAWHGDDFAELVEAHEDPIQIFLSEVFETDKVERVYAADNICFDGGIKSNKSNDVLVEYIAGPDLYVEYRNWCDKNGVKNVLANKYLSIYINDAAYKTGVRVTPAKNRPYKIGSNSKVSAVYRGEFESIPKRISVTHD